MAAVKIFGEHDARTREQMARCMQHGSVVGGVLCADGHLGYAQPVGGVIAYEEHVSVSGVGFDIACGNMAVKLDLPKQAIAVVHRADGSGTTFNFAYYLSNVNADWRSKIGFSTSVQWPVGIGAKGNEGVANNVAQTKGSIGYVEYAYALQNKLTYMKMVNKDGKAVSPTSEAFQAAAANADWKSQPGYGVILANQPGDKSWPMTAATWILIYKRPADPAATGEALKFFAWAYRDGGRMAETLDYVPMPANVVSDIERYWMSEIKDASGKPVFAMTN